MMADRGKREREREDRLLKMGGKQEISDVNGNKGKGPFVIWI